MPGRGLVKGGQEGIHIGILQDLRIDRKGGDELQQQIGLPVLLTIDNILFGNTKLIGYLSLGQSHNISQILHIHVISQSPVA